MSSHSLYAITVFGYRKEGMTEQEYHDYVGEHHAPSLKALLAQNDIVSYTMQHITTDTNQPMLRQVYGDNLQMSSVADCDTVIQIVFKDIKDYLRVRSDPHFINVVDPDHRNFANPQKVKFAMGWFQVHVKDGQVMEG